MSMENDWELDFPDEPDAASLDIFGETAEDRYLGEWWDDEGGFADIPIPMKTLDQDDDESN